ncbi:MAG: hypothetical protein ABJD11_00590 [Gemmatimonadota bacterium]
MSIRTWSLAAWLFSLAVPLEAQFPSLPAAAEAARSALSSQNVEALVASSPRILLQLPGADPSAPVGQAQASALLRAYFRRSEEVALEVRAAREVGDGRGYVELRRRFRVSGTQEMRDQTVFLGYTKQSSGWVLVEVRISG